jgi:hypothetical protein
VQSPAGFARACSLRLLAVFRPAGCKTAYETGALEMSKKQFSAEDVAFGGLTGTPRLKTAIGYRFPPRRKD